MFSSYKNRSVNLFYKSIDWFPYDGNINFCMKETMMVNEWVKSNQVA